MRLKYSWLPWLFYILLGSNALFGRDSLRVDSMLIRVKELNQTTPPKGLALLKQLEEESVESGDKNALFRVRINLSIWESNFGNADSAHQILLRLEAETQDTPLYPMRGSVLHNLGKYHQDRGEYSKALTYFLEAQNLFEQTDQKKGLASVAGKLAFIYKAQKQIDRAKEYYLVAIAAFKELGYQKEYITTLHNFGFLYMAEENYVKAESLFHQVVVIAEENNLKDEVHMGQFALAGVFVEQEKLAEAEKLFNLLHRTDFIQNRPDRKAGYGIRFGTLKFRQKNYPAAIPYCLEAYEIGQSLKSLELQKSACLCLSNAYHEMGNHGKAFDYQALFHQFKDSLEQTETQALLANIRAEYDFEKVEKELAQSNLEKEREQNLRREAEQNASNQRRLWLFLLVLLVLAFGFLVYYLLTNRKIQRKNKVIQSALAEKEVLLGEVHHRVKNNLQLISSIIDLQARSTNHAPTEKLLEELRNRIHAITVLHQQLYQQPELHAVRTKDYLPPILDNLRQTLSTKVDLDLTYELDDFSMPVGTAISVGLMVSELVTNSFRHAFVPEAIHGKVWLNLRQKDGIAQLEVSDNGSGSANSTENFGMRMIRSLSRQMKADLQIENNQGTQTTLSWKTQK